MVEVVHVLSSVVRGSTPRHASVMGSDKWLRRAGGPGGRRHPDTDGIRENAHENAYAERQKMCISCCTLMTSCASAAGMHCSVHPTVQRCLLIPKPTIGKLP